MTDGSQPRVECSIHETTRRTFLRSSAAAAALAVVPTIGAADRVWMNAETPIGATLYDVETTVEGEYAVGASGYVPEREPPARRPPTPRTRYFCPGF